MTLVLPNDIINSTPADATSVEQNYSVIEQYVNANCITRDGTVAMQAPLQLVGDPTQDNHAANKAYIDAIFPVGIMLPYAGVTAPAGAWAICNGAVLNQTTYPELYAVLGARFGAAAAGSFVLPNLVGRTPIGVDAAQTDIDAVGKTGGTTVPPLRAHLHSINHDHPSTPSGHESEDHTHYVSLTTSEAGVHIHQGEIRADNFSGFDGGATFIGGGGNPAAIAAAAGAHTHSVSGASGGRSLAHTHPVDTPLFAGDSGSTGTDTAYRPPFVAVVYIIRVA